MRLKMMAIHDSKSESFGRPLFFRAYGEAERAFSATVNDGQSDYAKFPHDFALMELGEFDDVSGVVIPLPAPRLVVSGAAAITTDPKQLDLLKAEA